MSKKKNEERAARAAFGEAFNDLAKFQNVGPLGAISMAVNCAHLFVPDDEDEEES